MARALSCLWIGVIMFGSTVAGAQLDTLQLIGAQSVAGDTCEVRLILRNHAPVSGVSCTVGFDRESLDWVDAEAADEAWAVYAHPAQDSVRVVVLDSDRGGAMPPGVWTIVRLRFAVGEGSAAGEYPVVPRNAILADDARPPGPRMPVVAGGRVEVIGTVVELGRTEGFPGDTVRVDVGFVCESAVAGFQVDLNWRPAGGLEFLGAEAAGRAVGLDIHALSREPGQAVVLLADLGGAAVPAGRGSVLQALFLLRGRPEDVGLSAARAIVSDPAGISFPVIVRDGLVRVKYRPNRPPQFTLPETIVVVEDTAFMWEVPVMDLDGDPLSLALVSAPGWLTLDGSTGVLSGSPGDSDVGEYTVAIRVSDGEADTEGEMRVRVENRPPVIQGTPPVRARVGVPFWYEPEVTNLDGGTFRVISETGAQMAETPEGWLWVPAYPGEFGWVAVAEDPHGGRAEQAMTVHVEARLRVDFDEILADPPAGDAGDANGDGIRSSAEDEFVEILNLEAFPVDLGGWVLGDDDTPQSQWFRFPEDTWLPSGGRAVVFGGGSPRGVPGIVFSASGRIGNGLTNSGDTVLLIDSAFPDTVAVGRFSTSRNLNQSMARLSGSWTPHGEGMGREAFSPGRPRSVIEVLFPAPLDLKLPVDSARVMTAMARYSDFVLEALTEDVEWGVEDTTIARVSPSGRLSGRTPGRTAVWFVWRALRSSPTEIQVVRIEDNLLPDGELSGEPEEEGPVEPGQDTGPESGAQVSTGEDEMPPAVPADRPRPVGIVIAEVLADPPDGIDGDSNGDGSRHSFEDEFVELRNDGAGPADLSGWRLGDDDTKPERLFIFPENTILAPGEFATVFGGGGPRGIPGRVFVDGGRIGDGLSNSGDRVVLVSAEGTDTLAVAFYSKAPDGVSLVWEGDAGPMPHDLLPGKGRFSPGRPRPRLRSLRITPSRLRLEVGEEAIRAAIGTFDDDLEVDLTEAVEWWVADTTVVRVAAPGRMEAAAAGTTGVTVRWEDFLSPPTVIEVFEAGRSVESGEPGSIGYPVPAEEDTVVDSSKVEYPVPAEEDTTTDSSEEGVASGPAEEAPEQAGPEQEEEADPAGEGLEGSTGVAGDVDGGPPAPDRNRPPAFRTVPDTAAVIGLMYRYLPRVEDEDGDSVRVRPNAMPAWLVWDGGALEGIPGAGESGNQVVVLEAEDGQDTVVQRFRVRIFGHELLERPPDARAGITWLWPFELGGVYEVQVDGGPVFERGQRTLVWRPEPGDEGDRPVSIAISGRGTGQYIHTVVIHVHPAPRLKITEILVDPQEDISGDGVVDGLQDQFIELYNGGETPVDLTGWTLGDDDGPGFLFPEGTVLNPGSRLSLAGGGPGDPVRGRMSAEGKIGNGLAGSDRILLIAAGGLDTLIDVTYRNGKVGASLVPDPEQPGRWIPHTELSADLSSPGRPIQRGENTGETRDSTANQMNEEILTQEDTESRDIFFEPFPNPFNHSTTLRIPGAVRIVHARVYSVLGQPVCTLAANKNTATGQSVVWDGRDDHGRAVGSGVYLIRVRTDAGIHTMRALLLR